MVAFSKTGERMVGQVAKRQAITNPDRTISSIKREMGSAKTNTNRDFTTRMRDWMNLYERQGYTFGSQVGGRFEKN